MSSVSALTSKEKGNAAFKSGDYPAAIGFYTSAILADRNEPTFPLNRAAAYLKLGKNEDAERDCTSVLNLSPSNVKALFRRGQARFAASKFEAARDDFQSALKLEPVNDAAKAELQKVEQVIGKGKELKVTSAAGAPKRRRVPISIVEAETGTTAPQLSQQRTNDSLITPVSSRVLESPASRNSDTSHEPRSASISSTDPMSFNEAKKIRQAAKPSRVGGGVFRSNGSHTIFPVSKSGQDVSLPLKSRDEMAQKSSRAIPSTPPMTLFNFQKNWQALKTNEERWHMMTLISPTSLPALFQTSLEASFLISLLETLHSSLKAAISRKDVVREYMVNLSRVPRFGTVLLFMSGGEKELAKSIWIELGKEDPGARVWDS